MAADITTSGDANMYGYGFTRGQITQDNDGTLTSPSNIIQTIAAARTIYYKYRAEHLKRIALYANIEGLLAGNPPYSPAELSKIGIDYIANFNTLDARSFFKKAALAYWNLLNQAETLVKFELDLEHPDQVKYADILAKNWDYVVKKWRDFQTSVNMLSAQLVKLGISPVIWSDERDWRWRVIELSKFFVSDQAQSLMSELTSICVESTFTAQYFFELYEDLKNKSKKEQDDSGWSIDELEKLLLYLANQYSKNAYDFIDVMDIQKRYQNGDTLFDVLYTDDIRIVHMLSKEYDGKVSHFMFHRTFDNGHFLFRADRQYDSINEAITIFTASPGEFTIHSNKGTGQELYSAAQAMMQLDCSIHDMARMSSTPLLRGVAVGSRDFEQIRFYQGVPTNIGTAEFVQNNLGANISQLINASNYFNTKLQNNLANAGSDPSMPDADKGSISPTQARIQTFKEFGVLKNSIAHFYSNFDHVVRNMTVKMLNSKEGYPGYEFVKEWKARCIAQGFPEELFKSKKVSELTGLPLWIKEVKASRVAGDGSTLARLMGLQELMSLLPGFGPRESKEFKRQYIMATLGPEYIQAFSQDGDRVDEEAGGASLAGVENSVMKMGEGAIFSMDNEHRSHFATHMSLCTYIMQAVTDQKMSPLDADKVFTVAVPHTGEHLQALSKSMFDKTFAEGQIKNYQQVTKFATDNRKVAEEQLKSQMQKQQEQQQAQQTAMTDEALKTWTTKNEEARKDYKIRSQVIRADEANQTRAEVMTKKVELDADVKRMKAQLDHQANTISVANKHVENLQADTLASKQAILDNMAGETPSAADIEGIPQL